MQKKTLIYANTPHLLTGSFHSRVITLISFQYADHAFESSNAMSCTRVCALHENKSKDFKKKPARTQLDIFSLSV